MSTTLDAVKQSIEALAQAREKLEKESAELTEKIEHLQDECDQLYGKVQELDEAENPEVVNVDRNHPLEVSVGGRRLKLTGRSDGSVEIESCGFPFRLKLE